MIADNGNSSEINNDDINIPIPISLNIKQLSQLTRTYSRIQAFRGGRGMTSWPSFMHGYFKRSINSQPYLPRRIRMNFKGWTY